MKRWHRYLSLPHKFGADPDDGLACDCVVMVWNVLRDAALNTRLTSQAGWRWQLVVNGLT